MEDVLAHLDNKNPSIKEETCKFLTRVFCGSTPATLPKGVLKPLIPALVKVIVYCVDFYCLLQYLNPFRTLLKKLSNHRVFLMINIT